MSSCVISVDYVTRQQVSIQRVKSCSLPGEYVINCQLLASGRQINNKMTSPPRQAKRLTFSLNLWRLCSSRFDASLYRNGVSLSLWHTHTDGVAPSRVTWGYILLSLSLAQPFNDHSIHNQPTNQPISQETRMLDFSSDLRVRLSVSVCLCIFLASRSYRLREKKEFYSTISVSSLCFIIFLLLLIFFPYLRLSLSSSEFVSLKVQCPKCSENPGVKSHLMSLWLRHLSPVLVFPPSSLPPSLLAYEIDARRKNFLIKSAGKPNPPVSVPTTFFLCELAHDFHTFTHTYPDEPPRKNKPLYSSPHHTTLLSPGQQPVTCPWLSPPFSLTLPHPILPHPPRCRKERFAAWEADAPGKACLKTACWKNRTRGPQNGAWKLDASSLRARRVLSGDAHPSLITHTGN